MKAKHLYRQIAALRAVHENLEISTQTSGTTVIGGPLRFEAVPKGAPALKDVYDIELHIPKAYSQTLPLTREVGGAIDRAYGHFLAGDYLCLGVAVEVRRYFNREPTLLGYVNNLVIPYLYNYRVWAETDAAPFGELAHGDAGILQYYCETLQTESLITILKILLQLLETGYKGHQRCPCGSGAMTCGCHGKAMKRLHQNHTKLSLRADFTCVLGAIMEETGTGQTGVPDSLYSRIHRQLRR